MFLIDGKLLGGFPLRAVENQARDLHSGEMLADRYGVVTRGCVLPNDLNASPEGGLLWSYL